MSNTKVVISLGGTSFRKGTYEIVESSRYLPDDFITLIAGIDLVGVNRGLMKRMVSCFLLISENICMKLRIKKVFSWDYNCRVLKKLATQNTTNIRFLGNSENVVPLIAMADLLVFAGRTAHFPRPVYEAWTMKKPVVVFDMNGISQNVADGIDGIIVKKPKGDFLAISIKEVLSCPEKAKEMGERGYSKAIASFGADENIEKIDKIYRSLMKDKACI